MNLAYSTHRALFAVAHPDSSMYLEKTPSGNILCHRWRPCPQTRRLFDLIHRYFTLSEYQKIFTVQIWDIQEVKVAAQQPQKAVWVLGSRMGWLSGRPAVKMQPFSSPWGLNKCSCCKAHHLLASWWPVLQEKWQRCHGAQWMNMCPGMKMVWCYRGGDIPGGCRARSCCTSSESRRSSAGNYERGCFCNCHEYTAAERGIEAVRDKRALSL